MMQTSNNLTRLCFVVCFVVGGFFLHSFFPPSDLNKLTFLVIVAAGISFSSSTTAAVVSGLFLAYVRIKAIQYKQMEDYTTCTILSIT